MNPQPAPQGHTPELSRERKLLRDIMELVEITDNKRGIMASLEFDKAVPLVVALVQELHSSSHAHLLSESARQSQRIEQLEGALAPFAKIKDAIHEDNDDSEVILTGSSPIDRAIGINRFTVTVGDVRRASLLAASTLNQTEQGK